MEYPEKLINQDYICNGLKNIKFIHEENGYCHEVAELHETADNDDPKQNADSASNEPDQAFQGHVRFIQYILNLGSYPVLVDELVLLEKIHNIEELLIIIRQKLDFMKFIPNFDRLFNLLLALRSFFFATVNGSRDPVKKMVEADANFFKKWLELQAEIKAFLAQVHDFEFRLGRLDNELRRVLNLGGNEHSKTLILYIEELRLTMLPNEVRVDAFESYFNDGLMMPMTVHRHAVVGHSRP